MSFVSINPFNGVKNYSTPFISDDDLDKLLDNSKRAYLSWRKLPVEDRVKAVAKISGLLSDNVGHLAATITKEMGKPIAEAEGEVKKVVTLVDYYVENAGDFLQDKPLDTKYDSKTFITYQPLGGILGIMPWNYPFWQVFRFAIPTLLAGNTVLLKHAPNVPLCALEIEKIFEKALPKHVYQNLFIDIPQLEKVVSNPFVQGASLTGSERAGRSIAELCGKYLKKTVLELGGNDPFVLMKDADIEKAVSHFVLARMSNNGQICIAAKRLFVHQSIYQEVKELLIKKLEKLKIGNPQDRDTNITCLAKHEFVPHLKNHIDRAKSFGFEVISEREQSDDNQCVPLLLEYKKNDIVDFDEEVFGPVAMMFEYDDEEDLLERINASKYGLAASIWSKDTKKALRLSKFIDVGNISINKMVTSDPAIPFGGVKNSGYGREMGQDGIMEFVNKKSVVVVS